MDVSVAEGLNEGQNANASWCHGVMAAQWETDVRNRALRAASDSAAQAHQGLNEQISGLGIQNRYGPDHEVVLAND
jgi:hypothetical protein